MVRWLSLYIFILQIIFLVGALVLCTTDWTESWHVFLWLPPSVLAASASLRVPGADSDDETKTPSASPHHGRSRPPSLIADSSSESDEGDARGEVR